MANSVKIKRGPGTPTSSELEQYELGWSTGDSKLYINNGGTVVEAGGGSGDIEGVTAGSGLSGGGTSGTVTLNHADTSSAANLTASSRTYVSALTFDTYGHVTGYSTATETVTDTNTTYSAGTGLSLSGTTFNLGNHSGDLITSGTVAAARIANLPASKITSGTFADARIASATEWNQAYAWGDHSTAGYLTSFDITTQTDPKYLRSNAADTSTGKITFSNGMQDNVSNVGTVGSSGLEGNQLSTTDWSNLPVGFGGMMRSGNQSYGNPGSNYFYFHKIANRDSGGGWGGIAVGYNSNAEFYVGTTTVSGSYATWSKIWNESNDGSGSGLDADLLDGYHLSTTRNSANTVPVRDGNGYLNLGWINTTSGHTTNASSDYYVNTNDGYIRKKTLANVRTEIMGVSSGASFLRSDADDTWSGNISTTSTNGIRFGSANQTDGNDGFIAAGRFASGLNIVGTQTVAGQGRKVRIYGDLIDSAGVAYIKTDSSLNASNLSSGTVNNARLNTDMQLSAAAPRYKLQETGVTNNPVWWMIADGGNYSIRLNNGSPYPFAITTNSTNNAVDRVEFSTTEERLELGSGTAGNIFRTSAGYIQFGPLNSGGAHVYTDTAQFYFNKRLTIGVTSGEASIRGYNGLADLVIDRASNSLGNDEYRIMTDRHRFKVNGNTRFEVISNRSVVHSNGANGLVMDNDEGNTANSSRIFFEGTSTSAIFQEGGDLSFRTTATTGSSSGTERFRINTNGVQVHSGALGVNVTTSATDGRIDAGNDVVAFSTSDKRLKENIKPLDSALDKVLKISGVSFDWKELTEEEKKTIHGNEGHDVGVIAQEIEEVLPEVVTTRDSGYKAVKYEKIVPLLIEAIKEQQKQIEELKNG